jgi:hypothetical protein
LRDYFHRRVQVAPRNPEQDEHLLDLPERAADLADGFLRRSAAGGQQAA